MQKLFLSGEMKALKTVDRSEEELQQFIWDNQKKLFQECNFIFVRKEFSLKGSKGDCGSIDILAYNSSTNRFVIIELKQDFDKGAIHQAIDYRSDILKNFGQVYLDARKYSNELPDDTKIDQKAVDIIVIAKRFNEKQEEKAKDKKNGITLIKYNWFENDVFLFDYVHESTPQAKPPKPTDDDTKPLSEEELKGIVNIKCDDDFRKKLQTFPINDGRKLAKLLKFIKRAPEKFNHNRRAALWERIVEKVNAKDKLKGIPYTKENVNKLRNIIERADKAKTPNTSLNVKYDTLLVLLELLELLEKHG